MPKIFVIHENDDWVVPLRAELRRLGLPYEEWHLDQGALDLTAPPPDGVFYNRMSASSHTRGHRFAPEYTAAVLAWLERHDRRVLNAGRALQLEVSKVAQYMALEAFGIRVPRTAAAVGREEILTAADGFAPPFITKHNRAGKGLGVRLFQDHAALAAYVTGPDFEDSVDGITLIQDYVAAPEPCITRVEFIGRRLLYAVRVDTSDGFELCPADACRIDDAACPAGEGPAAEGPAAVEAAPMFQILDAFDDPLVARYQAFLAANDIHLAGIEFIVDPAGRAYTYDVNTNTNYNAEAEAVAGIYGMRRLAEYLGEELAARTGLAA